MSYLSRTAPLAGAPSRPRPFALLASAVLLLAVAFFAGMARAEPAAVPAAAKIVEIRIDNFAFTPAELTIAAGTTVKWVNHDDIPHQVAETSAAFKSQALDTDDAFSMTFDKPGEVDYFCTLHPKMTGKITVTAETP